MGSDGALLLNTSTYETADIKAPVAGANNGAPMTSNWEIGPDGMVYSHPNGWWEIRLPDGTVMIDAAYYFDKDGSIYDPYLEGKDRSDDYLVGVRNGEIYYPTPVSNENGVVTFENGTTFLVISDPTLYTVDGLFVTLADSVNPAAYDEVIIVAEDAQYVLGSQWYYSDPLTYEQGYKYFTRIIAKNGDVSVVKSLPVNSNTEVELALWTVFKADGTVQFLPEGATVSADRNTVTMAGGVKHIRTEVVNGDVTEYVWTLVLANGDEYSEGVVFVYEDGSVAILDI